MGKYTNINVCWKIISMQFMDSTVYKVEYFAGLLNIFILVVTNVAIWQSLYFKEGNLESVQYKLLVTYVMVSVLLQILFIMDETIVENQVREGTIFYSLLRPVGFQQLVFFSNLGKLLFNFILLFVPSFFIISLYVDVLPPPDAWYLVFFVLSLLLGYFILYEISLIVWIIAFDRVVCFGLVTLKNAVVLVLSGALVPIWFMPSEFGEVLLYLPFQKIYYFPISVYLGEITETEVIGGIAIQILWIFCLFILAKLVWNRNKQLVVVQGG